MGGGGGVSDGTSLAGVESDGVDSATRGVWSLILIIFLEDVPDFVVVVAVEETATDEEETEGAVVFSWTKDVGS